MLVCLSVCRLAPSKHQRKTEKKKQEAASTPSVEGDLNRNSTRARWQFSIQNSSNYSFPEYFSPRHSKNRLFSRLFLQYHNSPPGRNTPVAGAAQPPLPAVKTLSMGSQPDGRWIWTAPKGDKHNLCRNECQAVIGDQNQGDAPSLSSYSHKLDLHFHVIVTDTCCSWL